MMMAHRPIVSLLYVSSLLAAAAVFSGCGPGYTAVRGEDDTVFFPSLRVSYPLVERTRPGPADAALEVDVSRGRGTGHQMLAPGETVSLGGTTFPGPSDIQQTFSLDVASITMRARTSGDNPFYADLWLGILYTDLDLRLRSGGMTAHHDFHDGGGIIGIGIGSRIFEPLLLDARFGLDVLPFNFSRWRDMQTLDFQASYWLSQHVAVTGGYRRWKYRELGDSGSDVNALVWQGFSAGLEFSF